MKSMIELAEQKQNGLKVIHAFSCRRDGNMSLSYGNTADSLNNRKGFLNNLGIGLETLVCAKQVHGCVVKYVRKEDTGRGALNYDESIADTDAFITDKVNLPIAVFTADCLSAFLYDPLTPAIGIVHAGWRGTKQNIASKAVRLMQETFSTKPSYLRAFFGPAIRECCYEVKEDFINNCSAGITKRNGRYYFDLVPLNRQELLDSGVREANIVDSKICTSCQNSAFFSYRKEGNACGRLMSVMMLAN